jgi:hypothetical protein
MFQSPPIPPPPPNMQDPIKTALLEKNKQAARVHLIRIQNLLAQKPARKGIYD